MDYTFSRVICLTDSMIVRAQIQKENYAFKMFTATRIGEIRENSEPSEWLWIGSTVNPADMTTRATDVARLSSSLWKEGPKFLKLQFDEWPVKTECYVNANNLPDKVLVNVTAAEKMLNTSDGYVRLNVIELNRFNSYTRLINVTAIVLCIARIASFKVGGIINDSECYNVAENEWIKFVQRDLGDWKGKFKRLGPWQNEDGLIVVGERITEWFKMPWNQEEIILLPQKHRFTYLYCLMIHDEDHTIDTAVAKIRKRFWVPQLTKIIRKIKYSCVKCRKRDKKIVNLCGEIKKLKLDQLCQKNTLPKE